MFIYPYLKEEEKEKKKKRDPQMLEVQERGSGVGEPCHGKICIKLM